MNEFYRAVNSPKAIGCEYVAWAEGRSYACGCPVKAVFTRKSDGAMLHVCGIHARVLRKSRGWKEVTS